MPYPRTLIAHEPALYGLLDGPDGPAARPLLLSWQERSRAVLDLLAGGQTEAGARRFMETIAFGPGYEERDPESHTIDLPALAHFLRPVLLTEGEVSEPFFSVIVDKLARALPQARRRTLIRARHVPQASHPAEYVEVVTSFIEQVEPHHSRAH